MSPVRGHFMKEYSDFVEGRATHKNTELDRLVHGVLGCSGEAGELTDTVKKLYIYNQPITAAAINNIKEELGDMLFYIQLIANAYDWTIEDLMDANMVKLIKRYPTGYNDKAAMERADKKDEVREQHNGAKGDKT